jgi:uncharacterized membrane protein YdfJ with MMPL/SSD domain
MQAALDRLWGFLERRRYWVLGVWVVLLLAALPFTLRQTDHLTSGGFSVPGSGSEAVDHALADFEGAQAEPLAVVVAQRPDGDAAAVRAEIDRVDSVAAKLDRAELSARAEAAAKRDAGRQPVVIAQLDVRGDQDQVSDLAVDLRDELGIADGARDGVQP